MKRILTCLLALALAISAGSAQATKGEKPDIRSLPIGDTRSYGLAGAMTAVNDDMNTLFFNPAGLPFLRRNYFTVSAGLGTSIYMETEGMGGSASSYESDLAAPSSGFDARSRGNSGEGTSADTERNPSYYSPLIAQPSVVLGGKGWGLALTADYLAYVDNGADYSLEALDSEAGVDLPVLVSRRIGAVAGLGFNLGPIALGANMKYYTYSDYDFTLKSNYNKIDPASALSGLFVGNGINLANASYEMNVGLGAIVTLGVLNVGAYYDNMMPFINAVINKESYSFDAYLDDCFKTMSVGLSLMPSNDKLSGNKSIVDLLASLDLKNLGDNENRELCTGLEAGFDLWNVLVATARVGYRQALPTADFTVAELVKAFAPENGEISAGITAKFLLVKADLTLLMPLAKISMVVNGENAAFTEMKVRATASICL
jgi:hypothetical protein